VLFAKLRDNNKEFRLPLPLPAEPNRWALANQIK
jgi:hypothetical protein